MGKLDTSVNDYLDLLEDTQTRADARKLIDMMQTISGHSAVLWNVGTVGFDSYHFKYESGREGDCQAIGFYPRKDKITVYLMDGTAKYAKLLDHLGKHSSSRVCVYIKRLSDIKLTVLEQIVRESYDYVKSQDGSMHRV